MAKYSYITDKTHNNRKIQVESAKRDGSGKNIENNYAKQNGNYQSLTAGLSNNFDTKKVMVDESAYNFRPTATMGSVELEVGSPCKVKKIIGGTIVFNQLIPFDVLTTREINGITITNNNDGSWTLNGTATDNIAEYITGAINLIGKVLFGITNISTPIEKVFIRDQYSYTSSSSKTMVVDRFNGTCAFSLIIEQGAVLSNVKIVPQAVNLTQMFGSTIADYIYSLEQANAGSGVAWFKRYFPKEYYAYNSGELVSVKTQGKKITHFNQWDEEWEVGGIEQNGGTTAITAIRAKNLIKVIPNTDYYFKVGTGGYLVIDWFDGDGNNVGYMFGYGRNNVYKAPANAVTMLFAVVSGYGETYNHDICINFHYDGERDGEYEPYNSETYACDDVELRGIPQLDENNNLAFDGDEYANDGNVTRKYGIVDLGTLEWWYDIANKRFYSPSLTDAHFPDSAYVDTNIMCKKYLMDSYAYVNGNAQDKCIGGWYYEGTNYLDIADNSFNGVVEDFVSSLNGVYLVYELATPTDENSIPFTEVQECDNWGTEEWLAPTTDTRPCEVPVGHETDYLSDLKAKLEVAPTTPNENGVYVMEHNASGNTYTPIATWLTNNGYAKADTLPTKDSVGGTLRQLLSVKETLDFDNTAYVDLGSLTWTIYDTNVYVCYPPNLASYSNDGVASPNILCSNHKIVARYYVDSSNDEKAIGQKSNSILFYSSTKNATQIQALMKGVLLAYEKAS